MHGFLSKLQTAIGTPVWLREPSLRSESYGGRCCDPNKYPLIRGMYPKSKRVVISMSVIFLTQGVCRRTEGLWVPELFRCSSWDRVFLA